MITIINVKHATKGAYEYCGRRNVSHGLPQSSLHNPKPLAHDTPTERDSNCAEYRVYLHGEIAKGNVAIITEIQRLADIAEKQDLALGCWCAPKSPCHCETIKLFVTREIAGRQARRAIELGKQQSGKAGFGKSKTKMVDVGIQGEAVE